MFGPHADEFEGQGQRSKVKVTRDKKRHFLAISVACVWFVFGKTSVVSYFLSVLRPLSLVSQVIIIKCALPTVWQ